MRSATRRLRYEPLEDRRLLTADFNGDGLTNAADYTVWRDNSGLISGATFAQGDANGDGAVDPLDYDAWFADYGTATLPGIFSILQPSGFIDTATPTITWEASPFATTYDVDVGLESDCLDVVQFVDAVTDESWTVDALAEGEYFVCVAARNAAGSRESSNSGLSFTYDVTPPGSFDITTPDAGDQLVTAPTVAWSDSIDAADYEVVVSASPDLSDPLQTALVSDTSLALAPLDPGAYYVGVTARDAAGNERPADNTALAFTIVEAAEPLTVFVTSGLFVNNGNDSFFPPNQPFFGSTEAADYHVTLTAANAGLIDNWDGITPVYRAVLSDDDVDARDRLPIGGRPVVNVLGETVADSGADLFSGNLQRAIDVNEFGGTVTSTLTAWTGSGTAGTASDTCGDWLNPSLQGSVGDVTATDSQWISSGLQTCFSQARFYGIGPFEPAAPAAVSEPALVLPPAEEPEDFGPFATAFAGPIVRRSDDRELLLLLEPSAIREAYAEAVAERGREVREEQDRPGDETPLPLDLAWL